VRRVFLNPDGSHPTGLAVIVRAATGVTYGAQCGGLANAERDAEGYLVLCPPQDDDLATSILAELEPWFASRASQGQTADTWPASHVAELAAIVARVVFWTTAGSKPSRARLALDLSQLADCREAWIPVTTPDGPGILTFDNSD
jgi:hypothetical protein